MSRQAKSSQAKSLADEVCWVLEYRHLHESGNWRRVWGDEKATPQQSLEECLGYVKNARIRAEQLKAGHVFFHPGFQARIYNTRTGEAIPGEIFV